MNWQGIEFQCLDVQKSRNWCPIMWKQDPHVILMWKGSGLRLVRDSCDLWPLPRHNQDSQRFYPPSWSNLTAAENKFDEASNWNHWSGRQETGVQSRSEIRFSFSLLLTGSSSVTSAPLWETGKAGIWQPHVDTVCLLQLLLLISSTAACCWVSRVFTARSLSASAASRCPWTVNGERRDSSNVWGAS